MSRIRFSPVGKTPGQKPSCWLSGTDGTGTDGYPHQGRAYAPTGARVDLPLGQLISSDMSPVSPVKGPQERSDLQFLCNHEGGTEGSERTWALSAPSAGLRNQQD